MAHYAKVLDGKVIQVIVAEPEFFDTFVDDSAGQWIKTSYNILGGVYYTSTNVPAEDQSVINDDEGRQRKNFAGVGFTYDETRNAFIPPKPPFASWSLNETTCQWNAPLTKPDGDYYWDEDAYQADNTTGWVLYE